MGLQHAVSLALALATHANGLSTESIANHIDALIGETQAVGDHVAAGNAVPMAAKIFASQEKTMEEIAALATSIHGLIVRASKGE